MSAHCLSHCYSIKILLQGRCCNILQTSDLQMFVKFCASFRKLLQTFGAFILFYFTCASGTTVRAKISHGEVHRTLAQKSNLTDRRNILNRMQHLGLII